MPNVRCSVTLASSAGVLIDRPVNVWHFTSDKVPATNSAIFSALSTFYNGLSTRLSAGIAQNGHEVKMYDLGDPQPRAPFYTNTFNFTSAPTAAPLPAETALCLSFQGIRVSGQSQARRRGRIYIGPIGANQIDANGRPVSALITALVSAGNTLLTASLAAAEWNWCVYSTTDAAMVQVTNGWVDNAWDTQRRRGVSASTRSTFAS